MKNKIKTHSGANSYPSDADMKEIKALMPYAK